VHTFTYYRDRYGLRPEDLPVAATEFERLVSLPIYPSMADTDVDDVVAAVTDIVVAHRR
jgi:dTDP-4-amino-4,6-dideoxygalactose transaminase